MVNDFEKRLQYDLNLRKDKGIFREITLFNKDVDFYSNDYLGLAKTEIDFNSNSLGASRLIGGTSKSHLLLEKKLSEFFETEASLCFNSGYAANLGVMSTLCKKGDVVLYDADCHSSIKDGIKLSYAKAYKFKHNSISDIERLLKINTAKNIFIITEGLFSMLGDIPPLDEILYLSEKYNAKVIIDEAHSAGVFGRNGKGIVSNYSSSRIVAKVVTFGKAFGSHGAAVLCNERVKSYLINFSRAFIYTTALPENIIQRTINSLKPDVINHQRALLEENISLFNDLTNDLCLVSHDNSPIKIISFKNKEDLKNAERKLHRNGFGVKAIYPPTVPVGKDCLRIIIHSFNSSEEIKKLVKILLPYCSFVKKDVAKT